MIQFPMKRTKGLLEPPPATYLIAAGVMLQRGDMRRSTRNVIDLAWAIYRRERAIALCPKVAHTVDDLSPVVNGIIRMIGGVEYLSWYMRTIRSLTRREQAEGKCYLPQVWDRQMPYNRSASR